MRSTSLGSTRRVGIAALLLTAACLGTASPSRAQLRAPAAGPERVRVTSVRAIVLHHGDREDLVIELGYEAEGPLTDVAWVLPLPSSAEWFGRVDGDPFSGLGAPPPETPLAEVAPYAMQPLRTRGAEGVATLSAWLRDGGLHGYDEGDLAYYAERDWTFFAARIRPPEGSALPATGRLPALHVTFRAERAIIPLRLLDARGAAVSITLLTATAPEDDALDAARAAGFTIDTGSLPVTGADPALAGVLGHSSAFPLGGPPGGTLARTTLTSRALPDPSRWSEEVSVPGLERRERLTGVADRMAEPVPAALGAPGSAHSSTEAAAAAEPPTSSPTAPDAATPPRSTGPWLAAGALAIAALLGMLAWRKRSKP